MLVWALRLHIDASVHHKSAQQQQGRYIPLVGLLNTAITTMLIPKYSAITRFNQPHASSGSEQKKCGGAQHEGQAVQRLLIYQADT